MKPNLRLVVNNRQSPKKSYKLLILLLIILISLLPLFVQAKTVKIAVIDTGFDFQSSWENASKLGLSKPKICDKGHYDYLNNTSEVVDVHGHGTHIAGLIAQNNEKYDYCLIILKFFDTKVDGMTSILKAYQKAIDLQVDIVNISGGGKILSEEECKLIKQMTENGIDVVAAAGNEGKDLNEEPFYPAMCNEDVIKVTNIGLDGKETKSSNYDSMGNIQNIKRLNGTNVFSLAPNNKYGLMTGTSQATAEYTARLLREKFIIRTFYNGKWGPNAEP